MLVLKELGAHERQPDHDVFVELRRRIGHAAHAVELAQLSNTHTAVFRQGVSRLQASLPPQQSKCMGAHTLKLMYCPTTLSSVSRSGVRAVGTRSSSAMYAAS